jgi:hypothetical protein
LVRNAVNTGPASASGKRQTAMSSMFVH